MFVTDFVNRLYAKIFYKEVGNDQFGNKYYLSKCTNAYNKHTRNVIYNGLAEPTKVPPGWHAWLHYMTDEIPDNSEKYQWQKPHVPNRTGTEQAYLPAGLSPEKKMEPSRGQYMAWRPSN